MGSRKRQRTRITLTDDDNGNDNDNDNEQPAVNESELGQDYDASRAQAGASEEPSEKREKELEIWDAFKEEHHEVLEQLPLSLHRQYKLMRELDSQSEVFHADLLASARRYIHLRESLAIRHGLGNLGSTTDVNGAAVNPEGDTAMQVDSIEQLHHTATVNDGPIQATSTGADSPAASQSKSEETTRSLLQHIAQISEEAIRTTEEKVSIAQTAYETVDRHIRLLDQAIKEQEAAISLGVRPGTHLAPILLPDLVVPRWARPSRVEHSPVPSLSPEPELHMEEVPHVPTLKALKKGKKSVAHKPPKGEKGEIQPPAVVVGEEPPVAARTRRTGVRLTIPAHPQPAAPTVPGNANEARYCYCNQVSFGTMIACDNEGCKLEWFHFGCTGLLDVPSRKTKWYCRECRPKMTQRGRSRM